MTRVKICGVTNWPDAQLAVDAGADFLGLNFYRRSPRYISPARARRVMSRLPRHVQAVGVFVDESPERIREIALFAGLRRVQLHGSETPAAVTVMARRLPVMKAFRVRRDFRVAALARYRKASAFLLDGFSARVKGGTGRTFDWSVARCARRYGRIFLAGGLTPENVAEAIHAAQPYAVDVASGVESRPGKKDPARLRAFMRAVESAQRKQP